MIFFKSTPYVYESKTESELDFCSLSECKIDRVIPNGKILLLADRHTLLRKKPAFAGYKTATLVDADDVNPLFAFDHLVGIVALGTSQIAYARYASAVLGIPCVAIPDLIDGEAILSPTVRVRCAGREVTYPAPVPKKIIADETQLYGQAEAYGRICSYAVSLFDALFLSRFKGREVDESVKRCIAACLELPKWYREDCAQTLLSCDLALASLSETGFSRGMVARLGAQIGNDLVAAETLLSVYALFFSKGYLRPYALPDYEKRAESIGQAPFLPDYETERLFETFEYLKEACLLQVRSISERFPQMRRAYFLLGGTGVNIEKKNLLELVRALPDYGGFSPLTLMREFGLLEEKSRKKRVR
ncbi:MAG: hypothetical protein J5993_04355 [Clostridia bacterium]|nr:hypothetical protein [Clostridia bacterium]